MNVQKNKSTMKFTIILSLFLAFFSVCPVWGATYYVKTGGDDNDAGTSDATAWATTSKVESTIQSGDTVYFRSQDTWSGIRPVLSTTAGVTYNGSTYGTGTRAILQVTNDQSAMNCMVVKIYENNVTFSGFDIDLNNTIGGGIYIGMYATNDISNTTINNCIVRDGNLVTHGWAYGIHVGNRNGHTIYNTTITNSTVHDFYGEGIALYQGWNNPANRTDGALVSNCTLYNNALGVLIANDSDNVVVEHCTMHDNRKYGIWIRTSIASDGYPYSVTSGPNNFIIRHNSIFKNVCSGINIVNPRYTPEVTTISGSIYGNSLFENGFIDSVNNPYGDGADIYIAGNSGNNGSDYPGCTFDIYNNTFYSTENDCTNSRASVIMGYWGEITAGIFNFKNNVVYSGDYRAVLLSIDGGTLNHSDNLVYRSSGAPDQHIYNGTSYDRAGVLTWEPSAENTDPLLIAPTTDFRVAWNSAAIDAGADMGITEDLEGNPIYGVPDIGAIEYQPPYVMGGDTVDRAANIRVYADGKFRNRQTPSGNAMGLVVEPVAGFGSEDTRHWMDITVTEWTSDLRWVEAPGLALSGSVRHTMKNLTPNMPHRVWVSIGGLPESEFSVVATNSSGTLVFDYPTYTGDVSFHVWEDSSALAGYFVKNGGNDSLNGLSDATAWATIGKVEATVQSGDTVYFRSQDTWTASTGDSVLTTTAGVIYDGSSYGTGTRAVLKPTATLTGIGKAIVKILSSDVTFRGFVVDGNLKDNGGVYIGYTAVANVDNVRVDDCVVHSIGATDTYLFGIVVGSEWYVPIEVSNVIIENTIVHDTARQAIAIRPSWQYGGQRVDTVLVRNCTVYATGVHNANRYGGTGIEVSNDADNVIVEYCDIYDNMYGYYLTNGGSVNPMSPNNAVFRFNTSHDNICAGILVDNNVGGDISATFHGNLLCNNGESWLYNYASDISIIEGEWGSSMLDFYNNTISSTENECSPAYGITVGQYAEITGAASFNFDNNILFTGDYPGIYDRYDNLTHSQNLVFRSSGAFDTHVICPLGTSYARDGVLTWEASARNADPLFVNSGIDFALSWDSSAIDAGMDTGSAVDLKGNPIYGLPDIGAFEYQPPYTMGTNEIDIASNVRVYGDGKFRNKQTPSGTTAKLSVIPLSSSKGEYLDIEIIDWGTEKIWKEQAIFTITATHTVGGLTESIEYDVYYTKEGEAKTLLTSLVADAQGEISFTYSVKNSTVIFEIE